jgi:hypothetical protein
MIPEGHQALTVVMRLAADLNCGRALPKGSAITAKRFAVQLDAMSGG